MLQNTENLLALIIFNKRGGYCSNLFPYICDVIDLTTMKMEKGLTSNKIFSHKTAMWPCEKSFYDGDNPDSI